MIVQGFLLYGIVRFARQPDDESDGIPIRGHTKLEVFWAAVPAIVIIIIGILSYQVLADIEPPKQDALVVEVKAFQYAWHHAPASGPHQRGRPLGLGGVRAGIRI